MAHSNKDYKMPDISDRKMQPHEGIIKCTVIALGAVCTATTPAVIDFDPSTVVIHVPQGWRTVMRENTICFACPKCSAIVTGKVPP